MIVTKEPNGAITIELMKSQLFDYAKPQCIWVIQLASSEDTFEKTGKSVKLNIFTLNYVSCKTFKKWKFYKNKEHEQLLNFVYK